MFDFEIIAAEWDGDWCGTGPIVPLPQPEPDPQPWRVAEVEHAVLEELVADGLWPFPDKPVAIEATDAAVEAIRGAFDDAMKDLETEDRLGNHEIQRLMQMMNANDTLEANVRKKTDDTANAIIGKI